MTEDCQKMTQATILIENRHKINGKFHDRGVWILGLVFGSGLKKNMELDPNPVCPERLNPDPVNIRSEVG